MSILNDKVYEGMDWLSQAVEPYHSRLNDVIAAVPDEYPLTYKEVAAMLTMNAYSSYVNSNHILHSLLANNPLYQKLDYNERDTLSHYFDISADEDVVVDGDAGVIIGSMKLVKLANLVDEAEVKKMMHQKSYIKLRSSDCQHQAIMDLGSLLFTDPKHAFYTAKSPKGRLSQIQIYMNEAVEKDHFRIRSDVAFENFVGLITYYLQGGHPTNLGEIYRYIMMARSGRVIYEAHYEKST